MAQALWVGSCAVLAFIVGNCHDFGKWLGQRRRGVSNQGGER
jgi:hypothetical protein